MRSAALHWKKCIVFLAVCFALAAFSYIRTVSVVPGKITLLEGEEYTCDFKSPFLVSVKADKSGILKLSNGDVLSKSNYLRLSKPISFKSDKNGIVNLSMRIFGLIPLKTMEVSIVPNQKLVACGNTVGVKLRLQGILVIGMSDVESADGRRLLPARESGIRAGDLLVEANRQKLSSIDDLVKEIDKSKDGLMKLKYKRGDAYFETSINPVASADDKKYHIGLWVRDSTAGIGTLTFYDPETKCFGALGHGITDIDTGALMPVENGEILESSILAIKKGLGGNPGELKGVFLEDRNKLGVIKMNSEHGIYGILNANACERIPNNLYPIGLRNQVKEGPAVILANIEGRSVEEYAIEIQKVSRQNTNGSKGMVIKITDKKLLEETGGIVQGMSGSPIIQNGKIIGAVTHVLVNDPTRGYGIFIESMVKNISQFSMTNMENAS